MLVLTRSKDESIVIELEDGRLIEILLVDFRGGFRVRLGVEAPRSISVHRKEIYERIQKQERLKLAPE